jgi:hypothetical protein
MSCLFFVLVWQRRKEPAREKRERKRGRDRERRERREKRKRKRRREREREEREERERESSKREKKEKERVRRERNQTHFPNSLIISLLYPNLAKAASSLSCKSIESTPPPLPSASMSRSTPLVG